MWIYNVTSIYQARRSPPPFYQRRGYNPFGLCDTANRTYNVYDYIILQQMSRKDAGAAMRINVRVYRSFVVLR